MHTEIRQHGYAHYPVVAVDFGHRSVQRLCRFEAVVDVNATEGISKLLRINGTTTVLPAESMHTSHRQTENPKKTKNKNLPKDTAGSPHHSANLCSSTLSRIRQSSAFSIARIKAGIQAIFKIILLCGSHEQPCSLLLFKCYLEITK